MERRGREKIGSEGSRKRGERDTAQRGEVGKRGEENERGKS